MEDDRLILACPQDNTDNLFWMATTTDSDGNWGGWRFVNQLNSQQPFNI